MIVDERIVDYIHSLETRNSDILETIEQEALKERVPIIRKEMQSFLKVLLLLKGQSGFWRSEPLLRFPRF